MKAKRDMEKSTFRQTKIVGNQLGQMTIEMILLTVVLVAVAMAATKGIRDNQVLAAMIGQPWQVVQGMIEDGVWMKQGTSKKFNPGNFTRRVSTQGDKP